MPDAAIERSLHSTAAMPEGFAAGPYLFSEAGLMRERVRVECAWVFGVGRRPRRRIGRAAAGCSPMACVPREESSQHRHRRDQAIESRTNHDVKAVEY